MLRALLAFLSAWQFVFYSFRFSLALGEKARIKRADMMIWWRWRELNPRPKTFKQEIYMLSLVYCS